LAEGFETRFEANYPDILRLARARLSREQSPISTVTLAHELYLNLRDRDNLKFASSAQFMAYASRVMRSLLVDMARERLAQKRSAELIPLTLGVAAPDLAGTPEQLLALDDALSRLGAAEPRLMQVAELRVVMGMQVHEIADALGVSEPTVKRDWQRARAFLHDALGVAP
jgi:RNA polymerase sigma factor (TIGR02999 family)